MSVEFRQRTPSEYTQLLWKRKWLIMLPAIAIAVAIAWVVWSLPNVYESTSLLIIKPPTIPNAMVPSLSNEDLSLRINNINQQVLSRSSLEPLIVKYNLYQSERQKGMPMEEIVTLMQAHITTDIQRGDSNTVPAFRISFRARDPQATRAVTGELASKYVNAQAEGAQGEAEQTRKFFEVQVEQAQRQLDEIDKQRLDYMTQNLDSLPSSVQALIGQLTGLREQQKSLISEIGRMRDNRIQLSKQLSDLEEQASRDNNEIAEQMADPKQTPAYGALITRRATLQGEMQTMLTQLRPENPDVKAKQAELDSVEREMRELEDSARARVDEIRRKRADRGDLRLNTYKYEIEKIDRDLARKDTELSQTAGQIESIQTRINSVPDVEVALESLNRDYQTNKVLHDQLLEKKRDADLAATVQINAQGETIQVIDPANLPQTPVAPKRFTLVGLGLLLGFGIGLVCAAAFEMPRLFTIQTADDAAHYTGLPVLASVPELLTPQEARRLPQRRMIWLTAGIIATILAIPALALILKLSHVFDRFVT